MEKLKDKEETKDILNLKHQDGLEREHNEDSKSGIKEKPR